MEEVSKQLFEEIELAFSVLQMDTHPLVHFNFILVWMT